MLFSFGCSVCMYVCFFLEDPRPEIRMCVCCYVKIVSLGFEFLVSHLTSHFLEVSSQTWESIDFCVRSTCLVLYFLKLS